MDKDSIVSIVCEVTDVSRETLFSPQRHKLAAHARMLAFYLIRDFAKVSSAFQASFWHRDHTTVLSGIRRVDHLLETSEQMRDWYMRCVTMIAASKRKAA